MRLTTLEILRRVRRKILKPENWAQGWWGRMANGEPCDPDSSKAVAWCLFSACQTVDKNIYNTDRVSRALGLEGGLTRFNDAPETTHADVIRVLNRAIRRLAARKRARTK